MAEILFFSGNRTHPDPEKDRRGSWKRGMPVVVFDDGHVWGREESKQQWISEGNLAEDWPSQGIFVIVKIIGITADRIKDIIEPQIVDDAGVEYDNLSGRSLPHRFRRRGWRVLVSSLPAGIRSTLVTDGEVTVTKLQVRNYIRRIRDDVLHPEL